MFSRLDRWFPWAAGVGFGLLLLPFSFTFWPLFCANLCLTGAAFFGLVRSFLRPSSGYDLKELRRVHDREAARDLMRDVGAGEAEQVYCIFCGGVYDPQLGACPNCKRV